MLQQASLRVNASLFEPGDFYDILLRKAAAL